MSKGGGLRPDHSGMDPDEGRNQDQLSSHTESGHSPPPTDISGTLVTPLTFFSLASMLWRWFGMMTPVVSETICCISQYISCRSPGSCTTRVSASNWSKRSFFQRDSFQGASDA